MRALRIAATSALLLNVTGVVGNLCVSWTARRIDVFRPGQQLLLPVGTTLEGLPTPALRQQHPRPCYLLRYESKKCPYCVADAAVLASLENALRSHGCGSVFLAPKPDDFMRPENQERLNLAFVDLRSAAQLPFFATPTTLVIGRNGAITWSKVGALEHG